MCSSDLPTLFAKFVHDAALKLLDLREVNQPQHIYFQRRQLRGWPHRRSIHRLIRNHFQLGRFEHYLTLHAKNPLRQVRPSRARAIRTQRGCLDRPAALRKNPWGQIRSRSNGDLSRRLTRVRKHGNLPYPRSVCSDMTRSSSVLSLAASASVR